MTCPICCINYYTGKETQNAKETQICSYICDTGQQCKLKRTYEDLCTLHSTLRIMILCPFCNGECCRICYRTFFLNMPEEPRCIHCKKGFTFEFLLGLEPINKVQRFTNAFVWGPLKEHRENNMLEQIMARLPTFQQIVTEQLAREIYKKNVILTEGRLKLLNIQNSQIIRTIIILQEYDIINDKLNILLMKNKLRITKLAGFKQIMINKLNGNIKKEDEIKIQKTHGNCLKREEGCNGFINHEWECGVCFTKVCSKCHNIKLKDHECNPDEVESIKALKDVSKPCPGCNQMIEKTMGCFARDTPVLMYDGSLKMSQEIIEGDILIGNDSFKRIVLDCTTGTDKLYKINQNVGDSYTVNSKHTLVLCDKEYNIHEIIVDDYLVLPDEEKNKLYGFKRTGILTKISIEYVGEGTYYGWRLDGNNLFMAPDLTILKNCSQMFCTNCHNFFDWNKLTLIKKTVYVHNPEHTAWVQKNSGILGNFQPGGGPPQEVDACNISANHISKLKISEDAKTILNETLRICNEIAASFQQYINPMERHIEKHAVDFLKGLITKDNLKYLVQRNYKSSKKAEFANIHRSMYVDSARNILVYVVNEIPKIKKEDEKNTILNNAFNILNNLREYTENNLANLGKLFNSDKPHLSEISARNEAHRRNNEQDKYIVNRFLGTLNELRTGRYYLSFQTRNILFKITGVTNEKDLIEFLKNNQTWIPSSEDIIKTIRSFRF